MSKQRMTDVQVKELVDRVTLDAMSKFPCLSWGSRDAVRAELVGLVHQAEDAFFDGGDDCDGAWETNDKFVVTFRYDREVGGTEASIALCLGEARFK